MSRCEHELKAYQLQYPALVGAHAGAGSQGGELLNELNGSIEELPPWIGQAKYMSPLLVAYEARIEELTEKNQEQLVRTIVRMQPQHDFISIYSMLTLFFLISLPFLCVFLNSTISLN